jgi:hypothetical protein
MSLRVVTIRWPTNILRGQPLLATGNWPFWCKQPSDVSFVLRFRCGDCSTLDTKQRPLELSREIITWLRACVSGRSSLFAWFVTHLACYFCPVIACLPVARADYRDVWLLTNVSHNKQGKHRVYKQDSADSPTCSYMTSENWRSACRKILHFASRYSVLLIFCVSTDVEQLIRSRNGLHITTTCIFINSYTKYIEIYRRLHKSPIAKFTIHFILILCTGWWKYMLL